MNTSSYRPLQWVTVVFLSLVVLALSISAALTWRELQRLELSQDQLRRMHVFQAAHLNLQSTLTGGLSERWGATGPRWRELQGEIDQLIELGGNLDPRTPPTLRAIRLMLDGPIIEPQTVLLSASQLMWEISKAENASQDRILESIRRDAAAQLQLEILAPVALIGFGILILFTLRRRIIAPLRSLEDLLSRLADGDFSPAPTEETPTVVSPAMENFNHLAHRLAELEAANRNRAESLEHDVRSAARALLQQQRTLAHAERLAATGELAASFAHEIRNPLAGIQMTLGNLRRELESPDLRERVDLMLVEAERLARLLNEMLDSSRHRPEESKRISLEPLTKDLLAITRYQIRAEVTLESHIDPHLHCLAPEEPASPSTPQSGPEFSGRPARRRWQYLRVCEGGSHRTLHANHGNGQWLRLPGRYSGAGIRPFLSTREHGTGLGLTIVRRLINDVGGQLRLENQDPQGACVTLLLPSASDHA